MSELTPLAIDRKTIFKTEQEAIKARVNQLRQYQAQGYSSGTLAEWLVAQTCCDYENLDRSRSIMNLVVGLSFFGVIGLLGFAAYKLTLVILGALQ